MHKNLECGKSFTAHQYVFFDEKQITLALFFSGVALVMQIQKCKAYLELISISNKKVSCVTGYVSKGAAQEFRNKCMHGVYMSYEI